MATNRVWALHGNVQNAIDYIINKDKTDNGLLVEAKNCSPHSAGLMWKIQAMDNRNAEDGIVGFHFQMSFEAGSVTPDEVMELSKRWIESITGGNHDYVLATHIDHVDQKKNPHIHSHIIVNPVNNVTGKKMQIYYKKDLPVFKDISNRICKEYGLEVLQDPKSKGKTYYEWMMENQGDSLKQVIAKTIDTAVNKVCDYKEFKDYLGAYGYEIEDGLEKLNDTDFSIKANVSLIYEELSTDTSYFIRIPKTKDYIEVNKDDVKWKDDNKTMIIKYDQREDVLKYDESGRIKSLIKSKELQNNFDVVEKIGRQGLRIKVPDSSKFIRCERIDKNDKGEGYSLDDVIDRINNNGRIFSDPDVTQFIAEGKSNKQALNRFYEEANIKPKWKNSKYYQMSKRDRFIEFKTHEFQNRMQAIHERREVANSISSLSNIEANLTQLQADLKEVNEKIAFYEHAINKAEIDKMENRLDVSTQDLDEYMESTVLPLKELKSKIKLEIQESKSKIDKIKQVKKSIDIDK